MQPGGIGPRDRTRLAAIGQAAGIGFAVVGGLLLPILLGLFVDGRTGRGPVFTLLGVVVGMALAGWELVRLTRTTARLPVDPGEVGAAERARRMAAWDEEHEPESERRERAEREGDRDRGDRE